ncbi:MAG TPA: FN3 associated domain-containing protein, partial [Bacteroidales bacterium]|nr:FN3 associated domain-containing protein [Bacteroidales bacterium]
HTWEKKNWGYRNMADTLQLLSKYESYLDMVHRFVKENGLSASIYTQTTDVETETNGLMTYDRKINKMGVENVYKANHDIIPPSITSPLRIFTNDYSVELKNYREGGKIFYTTDGTEPTEKSTQYAAPFNISETTTIRAFTKWNDAQSRSVSYLIEKKSALASTDAGKVRPGLKAQIYDGNFSQLPDFSALKPVFTKAAASVTHSVAGRDSLFAMVFEGYILIPSDGVYGLYVNSDDGSKLIIDATEPVFNDGIHGMREEGQSYPLAKGYHKLRIEYFQQVGGKGLEFLVEAPGEKKEIVPASWLFN